MITSKRSWAASVSAILLACLLGCSPSGSKDGKAAEAGAAKTAGIDRLKASWVGRYAQKDEKIGKLLGDNEGWQNFREMELLDAVDSFAGSGSDAGAVGKARSALELASAYEAMDSFHLQTEANYLKSPAGGESQKAKVRLGFVEIRRNNLEEARKIFSGASPVGQETLWNLGKAALALASGDSSGEASFDKAVRDLPQDKGPLASAASRAFRRPQAVKDKGVFGSAVSAMNSGDYAAAAEILGKIEYAVSGVEPGPDLFLYALLRDAYASMALDAVSRMGGQEAAYLSGRALWLLGDYRKCADVLKNVTGEGSSSQDHALIFGAVIDGAELHELAGVLRGAALSRAGAKEEGYEVLKEVLAKEPSVYTLAYLAAVQQKIGIKGPLGNLRESLDNSLTTTRMERIKMLEVENGEVASALLGARQADISRLAAFVAGTQGKDREALDVLDSAHQKKKGYKPDFINPPSFMIELSSAYAGTGQYAPATEILFELSSHYPAIRVGYESLKRLYASRTGGEAPPR